MIIHILIIWRIIGAKARRNNMQVFKGEDYKDIIVDTSDDYGKYFSNTSPFYDEKWSPFNLGIYMDRQDDKPKASKYIGVMPALDRNADQTEMFGEELPVIKIVSRFYADLPLKMLKRVLAGNDYYENPCLLYTSDAADEL